MQCSEAIANTYFSIRAKEAVEKLTGDVVTSKREFGTRFSTSFDYKRDMLTRYPPRLRGV